MVVRLGSNTLIDTALAAACEDTHDRWGLWGFSVFEAPGGDLVKLARHRRFIADRQWVFVASGDDLRRAGFPLLDTLESLHWTFVVSEPTAEQFERVGRLFGAKLRNPGYRARGGRVR
jgi:hypothetical protein